MALFKPPAKKLKLDIDHTQTTGGTSIPYGKLASTLEAIENTSSRLEIITILSDYFKLVVKYAPDDLLASIYLCLNRDLGVGEKTLEKIIAKNTGRELKRVKEDVVDYGDVGIVAQNSKHKQNIFFPPPPLTVAQVYSRIETIAQTKTHNQRDDLINSLFVASKSLEAKFVMRALSGKLRIGLAEQTILQALAVTFTLDKKTLKTNETILKNAFKKCSSYAVIVNALLKDGIENLSCDIVPGTPFKAMLANPSKSISKIFATFKDSAFTCEWKYDGERAQIHMTDDCCVSIFSRSLEDNTSKYPDIVASVPLCKTDDVRSFILDCEVVAWDGQKILPFQVLNTRKRKNAQESDLKVKVCVFMFDLLYLNGESLLEKTLLERRSLLRANFKRVQDSWDFCKYLDANSIEQVEEFLDKSIRGNCEGLMLKTLNSTYEIDKRSQNWLKLKKDYLKGVGDSLDLVVLGGYLGRGKRTGIYGAFLLGCLDKSTQEYQSICKIGTGFSDEFLSEHTALFKSNLLTKPKENYVYDVSYAPDHWFEIGQIWEIKCADFSLSPVYKAAYGLIEADKGISLRFPRFVRKRDDKNVNDISTARRVADLYANQDQIKNNI